MVIKPCLQKPYNSLAIAYDWNRKEFARDRTTVVRIRNAIRSIATPQGCFFLAICLRFFLYNTAAVRIRTAAVRTTYEINNDFGLGHISLKFCECPAIVARLLYEFVRLSTRNSYPRCTKSINIFGRGHYIA